VICHNLTSKLLSGSTGNYKGLEAKAATQEIRKVSPAEPGSVVSGGKIVSFSAQPLGFTSSCIFSRVHRKLAFSSLFSAF